MNKKMSYILIVFPLFLLSMTGVIAYIYQWGEPITSPTYSPSPIAYHVIRQAIVPIVIFFIFLLSKKLNLKLLLTGSFMTAIILLILSQINNDLVIRTGGYLIIYCWVFIFLYSNNKWIDLTPINKLIELLALFILIFLLYQIINYYQHDVLPTHSYQGIMIRYGSIYNDSIALGVMLPMYTGYFFEKYADNRVRLIFTAISSMIVALTGSFTAMGTFFLYLLWYHRKSFKFIFLAVLIIAACLLLRINLIPLSMTTKIISINVHMTSSVGWNQLFKTGILSILGLSPENKFVEPGYLLLLINYGILVLAIVITFHIYIFYACLNVLKNKSIHPQLRQLAGATQALNFSIALTNFNLPAILVFPSYCFLAIFSAIIMSRKSSLKT